MKIEIPRLYLLAIPLMMYGIGALANFAVMAHNGGQMPVLFPGGCMPDQFADDPIHSCMTAATHWKFLADWIVINHLGVASPGDLLLWGSDLIQYPAAVAWLTLLLKDINPNL